MTTQTEVLKMALEALCTCGPQQKQAITAIKEALAQPEQEPVAFICQGNLYMADNVDKYCTAKHTPLYTKEQL